MSGGPGRWRGPAATGPGRPRFEGAGSWLLRWRFGEPVRSWTHPPRRTETLSGPWLNSLGDGEMDEDGGDATPYC